VVTGEPRRGTDRIVVVEISGPRVRLPVPSTLAPWWGTRASTRRTRRPARRTSLSQTGPRRSKRR